MSGAGIGFMKKARDAAPVISAVILLALVLMPGSLTAEVTPGADGYFARVKMNVESMPYLVGQWTGHDMKPQAAAGRLLKPNVILQRLYKNSVTGEQLTLLVVHCGDARDMEGHYPPVCYPGSGWSAGEGSVRDVTVPIGLVAAPARLYRFEKETDGISSTVNILNFFMMPREHKKIAADMGAVSRATKSRKLTMMGAAQIQLITSARISDDRREEIVAEFMLALEPIIQTVTDGVREGDWDG